MQVSVEKYTITMSNARIDLLVLCHICFFNLTWELHLLPFAEKTWHSYLPKGNPLYLLKNMDFSFSYTRFPYMQSCLVIWGFPFPLGFTSSHWHLRMNWSPTESVFEKPYIYPYLGQSSYSWVGSLIFKLNIYSLLSWSPRIFSMDACHEGFCLSFFFMINIVSSATNGIVCPEDWI